MFENPPRVLPLGARLYVVEARAECTVLRGETEEEVDCGGSSQAESCLLFTKTPCLLEAD